MKRGQVIRRMQPLKFRDLEEMLDFLPTEERDVTLALRQVILNAIPGVREKLSYNVPFYSLRRGICFIWPSSVLWGGKKSHEGVRLGFQKGYLMRDGMDFLVKGSRKHVFCHDYFGVRDIDVDVLKTYLWEAVHIDQMQSPG